MSTEVLSRPAAADATIQQLKSQPTKEAIILMCNDEAYHWLAEEKELWKFFAARDLQSAGADFDRLADKTNAFGIFMYICNKLQCQLCEEMTISEAKADNGATACDACLAGEAWKNGCRYDHGGTNCGRKRLPESDYCEACSLKPEVQRVQERQRRGETVDKPAGKCDRLVTDPAVCWCFLSTLHGVCPYCQNRGLAEKATPKMSVKSWRDWFVVDSGELIGVVLIIAPFGPNGEKPPSLYRAVGRLPSYDNTSTGPFVPPVDPTVKPRRLTSHEQHRLHEVYGIPSGEIHQ